MNTSEILLIDDDPVSILLSRFFLEKSIPNDGSVRITSFCCPFKGLEYVKDFCSSNRYCQEHSRILLDLNMPGMDGWKFMEHLNSIDIQKRIKVIIHSSSKNNLDREKAIKINHVDYYLPKPMTQDKASSLIKWIS